VFEWNSYRTERLERVGDLGALSPDSVRGLFTLDTAAMKSDPLGPKVRELIALAVALNAGAAVTYSARVLDAVANLTKCTARRADHIPPLLLEAICKPRF
jgi:hypothetical protein